MEKDVCGWCGAKYESSEKFRRGRKTVVYAGGLCRKCYRDSSARNNYRKLHNPRKRPLRGDLAREDFNDLGIDLVSMNLPDPPSPTMICPGTADRLLIYQQRAEQGYGIFHEKDLKLKDVKLTLFQ